VLCEDVRLAVGGLPVVRFWNVQEHMQRVRFFRRVHAPRSRCTLHSRAEPGGRGRGSRCKRRDLLDARHQASVSQTSWVFPAMRATARLHSVWWVSCQAVDRVADGSAPAPLANHREPSKLPCLVRTAYFSRLGTIEREKSRILTFGKKPREIRFGGRSAYWVV